MSRREIRTRTRRTDPWAPRRARLLLPAAAPARRQPAPGARPPASEPRARASASESRPSGLCTPAATVDPTTHVTGSTQASPKGGPLVAAPVHHTGALRRRWGSEPPGLSVLREEVAPLGPLQGLRALCPLGYEARAEEGSPVPCPEVSVVPCPAPLARRLGLGPLSPGALCWAVGKATPLSRREARLVWPWLL